MSCFNSPGKHDFQTIVGKKGKKILDLYSPSVLQNVLSFVLQIFPYLAAFECNATSDWLSIPFNQSDVVFHSNLLNHGEKNKECS